VTADPEFGPFPSSQRHAAEQRARREHLLRMELAQQGVIDNEFRQIAEGFEVSQPDRAWQEPPWWRAILGALRELVWPRLD
jgi:hypothetical protein